MTVSYLVSSPGGVTYHNIKVMLFILFKFNKIGDVMVKYLKHINMEVTVSYNEYLL